MGITNFLLIEADGCYFFGNVGDPDRFRKEDIDLSKGVKTPRQGGAYRGVTHVWDRRSFKDNRDKKP